MKSDWRNDLAVEATGRIMSNGYATYTTPKGGKFIYGGPFALSCDHGCFHSLADHGQAMIQNYYCSGYAKDLPTDHHDDLSPAMVFERCRQQIIQCDAVVAVILKIECYATYFELGYAAAMNKPIFLFVKEYIGGKTYSMGEHGFCGDDLWFIKQSAVILPELEIPGELLEFNDKAKYHEYLQSESWKFLTKRKRVEAGYKCQLCNSNKAKLNVHHRTYDNIYHEKLDDLIVLCENCHKKFHTV